MMRSQMTRDRDRLGRRRSFRTPAGRSSVSWRWEVGLPLVVIGALAAFTVMDAEGSGAIFWAAVLAAGVGAAIFFSGMISR
jgi:hypothetical protein